MNSQFIIDEQNFIHYRLTPWDKNSLSLNTSEITSFNATDINNARLLLQNFEDFNKANKINFCYVRINAENILLKLTLIQQGFYQAEVSLEIYKTNIHNYNIRLPTVELIKLDYRDEATIKCLSTLARDSFDFSRFHDDVNISIERSRDRYYNWIYDLVYQKKEMYYVESKGDVVGFHVQEQLSEEHTNLILTGAKKGKSELALPLWHSALLNLKDRNIKTVSTLISANNVGVLNLYIFLQFKVKATLIGMHKRYLNDSI
jgi:hypothetical protein